MTFRQALDDYTNALVVAIHGGGESPELLDKKVAKAKRRLLRAFREAAKASEQLDELQVLQRRLARVRKAVLA